MTDTVYVADGDSQQDTAIKLLAAAEELDYRPEVVQRYTGQHAGWQVPEDVASKAGLDTYDPYEDLNKEVEEARKAQDKRPDAELLDTHADETDGPGTRYVDTSVEPDVQAGLDAVGGMDTRPKQTPEEDPQANLEVETTTAGEDDQPKKATKSTARKSAAKKSTAKKAAATEKES